MPDPDAVCIRCGCKGTTDLFLISSMSQSQSRHPFIEGCTLATVMETRDMLRVALIRLDLPLK